VVVARHRFICIKITAFLPLSGLLVLQYKQSPCLLVFKEKVAKRCETHMEHQLANSLNCSKCNAVLCMYLIKKIPFSFHLSTKYLISFPADSIYIVVV
jgi:hypothetical protein